MHQQAYSVTAKPASDDDWLYFMRHIAEWGWLHALVRLESDCLVIAESAFLKRVEKLSDNFKCAFDTPDTVNKATLAKYSEILVFVRSNELELVQALKALYPDTNVVSGIHEFSSVSYERVARTRVAQGEPSKAKQTPIVFLSMPNSGAEFFCENLRRNKLPAPWEFVGRPFISLTKLFHGIDFFEIIRNAKSRYSVNGQMAYLFQMDVLDAFFEYTDLSPERFTSWLQEQQARVVVFRRQDKFQQALINGLLRSTYNRSIWTMRKQPAFKFRLGQVDCQNVMDAWLQVPHQTILLDTLVSSLGNVHEVCVDEVIQNFAKSIDGILEYLDIPIPSALDLLDYDNNFWHKPEMQAVQVNVRRNLIDRLGLHVKTFG